MRRALFALVSVLLSVVVPSAHALEVREESLGLTLQLPDEMQPVSTAQLRVSDVIGAWSDATAQRRASRVVTLRRLGGVIGREEYQDGAPVGKGGNAKVTHLTWAGFSIVGAELYEEADGRRWYTINAQVPVKAEAVQLGVTGLAGEEAEVRATLQSLLDGLKAPSSWLSRSERSGRLARAAGRIGIIAGVLIGLWLLARLRRRNLR